MLDLLLDRLGDWNPQLFRELKSRLTLRSVAIVVTIALLTQGLILNGSYLDAHNNPNWGRQAAYFQTFQWLTGIFSTLLLIGGSFLITGDLVREGRKDTLNFIRLSPQSATNILLGKVLGVPALVYVAVLTTLPFHLWLGIASHLAIPNILGFYAVLLGCCAFFYSLSLLAGLLGSGLGRLQPWLCSGGILGFQIWAIAKLSSSDSLMVKTPVVWTQFFSPVGFWQLLLNHSPGEVHKFQYLQWFYLSVGSSTIGLLALTVVNSAVCTYGIWQVVVRQFHSPQATLLSKRQSYWLIFGVNVMLIGFMLQSPLDYDGDMAFNHIFKYGFVTVPILVCCNVVMPLGLTAALTPHRSVLQEWARYRHQQSTLSLMQDLIWGEKSPAIVAVAINLAIASLLLLPWVLPKAIPNAVVRTLFAGAFLVMILLIYATIIQLALLTKTKRRSWWAISRIAAIVSIILLFSVDVRMISESLPFRLFSPYLVLGLMGLMGLISNTSFTTLVTILLGQVVIFTWLNLRFTRQLKRLDSSEFLVRSS